MPSARFFFDAGSGATLWADTPIDLGQLAITQQLRDELSRLIERYDTSLNWDYPPDPGPWREAECLDFNQAVRAALARLRAELGPAWRIQDKFTELHEDPDLDRYLADPAGFRRRPTRA